MTDTIIDLNHDDGVQPGGPIGAVLFDLALGYLWLADGKGWSAFGGPPGRGRSGAQIDKAALDGLLTIEPGPGMRENAEQLKITDAGRIYARRWAAGRAIQLLSRPPAIGRNLDWSRDQSFDSHRQAIYALTWAVAGTIEDTYIAANLPDGLDDMIRPVGQFLTGVDPHGENLDDALPLEPRIERFVALMTVLSGQIFIGLDMFEAKRLAALLAAVFTAALNSVADNADAFMGGEDA